MCVSVDLGDELRVMLEPHDIHNKRLIFLPVNDNSQADSIGGSHW
jgi:hypothetical protein